MEQLRFIKIRTGSYNLFKIIDKKGKRKIVNKYDNVRKSYLKTIDNEQKAPQEYKLNTFKVVPLFMGFQYILEDVVLVDISEKVENGFLTLKNLLTINGINTPDNVLYYKPTPFRVEFAFIFDYEITHLKAKLSRLENDFDVYMFSNSDILTKERFDLLINNYKKREYEVKKWKRMI